MIQPVLREIKVSENSAVPLHIQIAREIENFIRGGRFKEGERLPPTLDLVKLLGVTIACVQRAMKLLDKQGLVHRHPRRGTFVTLKSARPSVGILVGPNLLLEQSQFSRHLATAVKNAVNDAGLNPRIYDALVNLDTDEGKRSINELSYDLRHQRFNGLFIISGSMPRDIAASPSLPHVAYSFPRSDIDVHIDHRHFVHEATRWLLDRGVRKPAFIHSDFSDMSSYMDHVKEFKAVTAAAGLKLPPSALINARALMGGSYSSALHVDRAAYGAMSSIFKQWRRERYFPDGIILQDDIMVRGVAVALQEALKEKDHPPQMIVLSTEGIDHFYALPVARYTIASELIAAELLKRFTAKFMKESVSSNPVAVQGKIIDAFH